MNGIFITSDGISNPVTYLIRELDSRYYNLAVNYKILFNIIDIDIMLYDTAELIILKDKILTQARPPMITIELAERLFRFRLLNVGKYTKTTSQQTLKKALNLKGYSFKLTVEKSFTISIYRTSETNHLQNWNEENNRRQLESATLYSYEEIRTHALQNNQHTFKSYDYLLKNGTLKMLKVIIE